jgi:ankyrin repeat protein
VCAATEKGHTDSVHVLLKAGVNARDAEIDGNPAFHIAAKSGHTPVLRVLAEIWPLDRRPWKMFLMGGGAASELQDYLAPPANRTTRNFLPRLYSKPDMVKEIFKYLHKPRYVDVEQLDGEGRTAAQVATAFGKHDMAALLQGLGANVGVDDGDGDDDGDGGDGDGDDGDGSDE